VESAYVGTSQGLGDLRIRAGRAAWDFAAAGTAAERTDVFLD
jgi:hypothetical protein